MNHSRLSAMLGIISPVCHNAVVPARKPSITFPVSILRVNTTGLRTALSMIYIATFHAGSNSPNYNPVVLARHMIS
jgi:hypothetical protein